MTISRSPLRYMGSKATLAPEIIRRMPEGYEIFAEVYGGGMSVLLRKPRTKREIYNDLNGRVCNFFRVLRDDTRWLVRAIKWTPFSRAELKRAWFYDGDDPRQQALATYIIAWQSWGASQRDQSGWRFQVKSRRAAIRDWNNVKPLWETAERLKGIQIENDDALNVLKRYDTPKTLFYVDPPYLHSTRMKDALRKGYKHEMTDEQHVELASVLHGLKGMVMLSGHPSPLYNELYAGWRCFEFEHYTINRARKTIEALWLSPNCVQDIDSLPLFASLKGA